MAAPDGRRRLGLEAFTVYPSIGLSTGSVVSTTGGTELSRSGFRGSLIVRWR
ncbi:MAG: hypothetical protein P3A29_04960 [Gemmatimonadota bacterium]|nr:hypothetical protein [Gemmatimonadota bacterium]MDQ8170130.1 hypothetical protein [Gemmatimonadota bacterium]